MVPPNEPANVAYSARWAGLAAYTICACANPRQLHCSTTWHAIAAWASISARLPFSVRLVRSRAFWRCNKHKIARHDMCEYCNKCRWSPKVPDNQVVLWKGHRWVSGDETSLRVGCRVLSCLRRRPVTGCGWGWPAPPGGV